MAKKKSKAKGKRTPLADRYKTQVQAESTLRFNPEASTLRQAIMDLAAERDQQIRSAEISARGIQQMAKESNPQLGKYTREAQGTVNEAQGELTRTLGSSSLAPAAARDAAGSTRRLAETLSNARSENVARANEAEAGVGFARQNAEARYASETGKVRGRLGDLAREVGAFEQGRTGELTEAARGRSVTRAGQRSTARTAARGQRAQGERQEDQQEFTAGEKAKDRAAADKRAKSGPGGSKPATAKEVQRMKTDIAQAVNTAKAKKPSYGRHELAPILVSGRPARNTPQGTLPAIKAAKSELAASVALDVAYDGHVSRRNAQQLHKLGISVKDLGLPTYKKTKPRTGSRGDSAGR